MYGSKLFLTTGFVGLALSAISLFAADEDSSSSYLDGFVLTQILQRVELSNTDLIELSRQSQAMKNSSEDLMVSRLKTWLSDEEKRHIETEALSLYPSVELSELKTHRHYVKYFRALEKAWQSDAAVPSYQAIARGRYTKIVDFDPFDQNRLLILVSRQASQELYLVDTSTKESFLISSAAPAATNTARFLPNEANQILVVHDRGLSVMDISTPATPRSEIITSERFSQLVIPPGSNAAGLLSLRLKWWSVEKNEDGQWELEETNFPSMEHPVEHLLTSVDHPGVIFIATNNTLNIWKPDNADVLKTIDIGPHSGWKSIFLHAKDKDTVTVLSSGNGIVSNLKLSTGEKLAEQDLGKACGRLKSSAALSANGERFMVSCIGDYVAVVDAKTLRKKGEIETQGAKWYLKALGVRSPYAITWDPLGRRVALIDTQKPKFAGYITRTCAAKLSLKVFSCLRPNPVQPVELQDVAINPWDNQRILTTNGIELTIWDTKFKVPRTISVFEHHLDSPTDIVIHPRNPNKVYLLKVGHWLAVIDFMKGAKKLVKADLE